MITTYKRQDRQEVVDKTFTINDAWFEENPKFKWVKGKKTVKGSFILFTTKKKYSYHALKLEEFNRANDYDNDFIPNEEEDRIGTWWKNKQTHIKHARGDTISASGLPQCPDQEFWADQYMFDRYNLVEPGKPDKDWANPGAQTDPKYKK